ncbi:hypothetical protein KPL70_016943 [Citrus sinensis]|nr:hypothetical protein KPL70_016943 [Citrus sinensis]
MPEWEGSASNLRVLRNALNKSTGLKVPTTYYYLVDDGYTNTEGYFAPYTTTRYHLSEWRDRCAPRNKEEFFNMKHSSVRNVIEQCFGLLKMRWAILRSPLFYSIKTHCCIITTCCLLHNLIRKEMSVDPIENELVDISNNEVEDNDNISSIEASDQWKS